MNFKIRARIFLTYLIHEFREAAKSCETKSIIRAKPLRRIRGMSPRKARESYAKYFPTVELQNDITKQYLALVINPLSKKYF